MWFRQRIHVLVYFQLDPIFTRKHQHIHNLIVDAGQTARRLDLIASFEVDFEPKRVAKQTQALIEIAHEHSHMKYSIYFCHGSSLGGEPEPRPSVR